MPLPELLANKDFMLSIIKNNFYLIAHTPLILTKNKDFILAAISINSNAFIYASIELKTNLKIFIMALAKNQQEQNIYSIRSKYYS